MGSAAKFICICGYLHTVPREKALDGLSVAHWRCTDCGRRFVLTHVPPDAFTPVYLDAAMRSGRVRETGTAPKATNLKNPLPPPAIEFACRCGERITAHSWMYGGTTVCEGCKQTLFLVLKYHLKRKEYVIVPDYPPKASSTK